MKKSRYIFFGVLFIILISVLTNPKIDMHKDAIKLKLNSYSQNKSGIVPSLLVGAISDPIIDKIVSCDNYLIFSVTKVNFNGKSKSIGIGLFGNVYVSTKEIDKAFYDDKNNADGDISYLDSFNFYEEGNRTGLLEKFSINNKNSLKYKGSIIFSSGYQQLMEFFEFNVVSEKLKIEMEKNLNKVIKIKYKKYVRGNETIYLVTEILENK